ncbi:LysR family transcriptional regulator [Sphingomonas paucimobilis]|uniref:LysR family transcriptional regulator n=1 Tax=Sphingomonas paucimobilis TaxID=13689 RepID=A0A7Y2PD29_SPHPI|nr:LysR family transcriptional regulator [Sphingomonas paucimobilis]NNG58060.1 LysR family transcriptional regulator [Sphingomonas paucimobilis]
MDPDIALFVDVVQAGSLAGGARTWRLSPAMVSKRIARLEARLGVRLLHRTTRRLTMTEAGAAFHGEVAPLVAGLRAAEARVSHIAAGPTGPLRVTAPTSFGRLWVAPYLPGFLARYPAIRLSLDLTDDFVDVMGERVDLAIRITAAPPSGLAVHRFADNRRVLCASPSYLAQAGTPTGIAALADHRLLAANGQLPWRLTGTTVTGDSLIETNSSEVVREMALAGAGIALRSLWDVADALADGRLVRVLPRYEGSVAVGILGLHAPIGAPAAVPALIAHLAEAWRDAAWMK